MDRFKATSWILLVALTTASSAFAAAKSVEANLHDAHGKTVGTVKLTQLAQGVKIELQTKDLPPGEHAFHVHEKGSCVAPDFKSAGEHFSPGHQQHGFDVAKGPHAGDMPNIIVKSDGTASVEVINPRVKLEGGPNALLKKGGTALVIHSAEDDYASQPSGGAGDRIACAELKGAGG